MVRPAPRFLTLGERGLHAALLLPGGAEPDRPLPVLLDPYGGPHHARVVKSGGDFLESQWFADHGFAVLVVDGRGVDGRGPAWDRAVKFDFGVTRSRTRSTRCTRRPSSLGFLDLSRVGIRGWSFGGYLAAMAVLRRPDVFHAAVDRRAGHGPAPLRHLLHGAVPRASGRAPRRLRAQLGARRGREAQRPRLLIHGLADDNVFVANTLRFSAALFEAGRFHELVLIPNATHLTRSDGDHREPAPGPAALPPERARALRRRFLGAQGCRCYPAFVPIDRAEIRRDLGRLDRADPARGRPGRARARGGERRRRGRLGDGSTPRTSSSRWPRSSHRCPSRASSTCSSRPASGSRCRSSRSPSTRAGARRRATPARRPGSSPTPSTARRRSSRSVPDGSRSRSVAGNVVILAGFQGLSTDYDITTLGRGGSDTTAVAMAAALGAEVCEIYTDVEGVFTADPRIEPGARKIDRDQLRGDARARGRRARRSSSCDPSSTLGGTTCALHVRRSFTDGAGDVGGGGGRRPMLEAALIRGVALDAEEAKVTLDDVPDRPGVAASIFKAVAAEGISVDMIVQNVSHEGRTDLSFTVPRVDLPRRRGGPAGDRDRTSAPCGTRPTTASPSCRSSARG